MRTNYITNTLKSKSNFSLRQNSKNEGGIPLLTGIRVVYETAVFRGLWTLVPQSGIYPLQKPVKSIREASRLTRAFLVNGNLVIHAGAKIQSDAIFFRLVINAMRAYKLTQLHRRHKQIDKFI